MTDADMSRRRFFRTFAGGTLGGMMLYAFPEEARARYAVARETAVDPDDEEFWAFVREQFPLRADPVSLNNGTMGPSPCVVIDASASILGFRLARVPFDRLHQVLPEKQRIVTRMVPENGVNCNRISTRSYNSESEVHRVAEAVAAPA